MKKVAALLALALAAVALVACGGDDDGTTTTTETGSNGSNGAATTGGGGGGGGGGSTIDFEADPGGGLAYTTDEATGTAGKATIAFTNPQAVPHDVAVEDSGGKELGQTETITEGSSTTTIDLKPGEYTFFCSVPGHREAGMEGTLTVK